MDHTSSTRISNQSNPKLQCTYLVEI
jgi:hypothetical protein